jgi:hypothetical protein
VAVRPLRALFDPIAVGTRAVFAAGLTHELPTIHTRHIGSVPSPPVRTILDTERDVLALNEITILLLARADIGLVREDVGISVSGT